MPLTHLLLLLSDTLYDRLLRGLKKEVIKGILTSRYCCLFTLRYYCLIKGILTLRYYCLFYYGLFRTYAYF